MRRVATRSEFTKPNSVVQLATARRVNSSENQRNVFAMSGALAPADSGGSLIDMWNRFSWVDYNGTTTTTHTIAPYTNFTEWLNKQLKMRYRMYQKIEFKNNGATEIKMILYKYITRETVDSATDVVTAMGYAATDVYDTSVALSLNVPWVPLAPIVSRMNARKEFALSKPIVVKLQPGQCYTFFQRRPWRTLDFDDFYNDHTQRGFDIFAGHTFGVVICFQGTLGTYSVDDNEGDSKVGYMDSQLNCVETYGMRCSYSRGLTLQPGDKIITNALATSLEVRDYEAPLTKVTGPDV